jgi:hypothetical protein
MPSLLLAGAWRRRPGQNASSRKNETRLPVFCGAVTGSCATRCGVAFVANRISQNDSECLALGGLGFRAGATDASALVTGMRHHVEL